MQKSSIRQKKQPSTSTHTNLKRSNKTTKTTATTIKRNIISHVPTQRHNLTQTKHSKKSSTITTSQRSISTLLTKQPLKQSFNTQSTSPSLLQTTMMSPTLQQFINVNNNENITKMTQKSKKFIANYANPDFHNTDYGPTGKPIHRATTILCVRKGEHVVMVGDGQVSLGPTVVKPNAKKIRRIGPSNEVIVGFAGSTADAFTLLGLLENQLEHHPGQLLRASVETAKLWRTDKMSRHLEAMLIASDENISLCISGNGDVIESHDGLLSIGSGSMYALSAARALIDLPEFDSHTIAMKAMNIAADICVYTNHNFVVDSIHIKPSLVPGSETTLSSPMKPDEPTVISTPKM